MKEAIRSGKRIVHTFMEQTTVTLKRAQAFLVDPSATMTKRIEGFTLIEIALVLAIAALIIAIAFIAFAGAQKSRRDTVRKENAAQMVTYLEQNASNNNGIYPSSTATLATFATTYDTAVNNEKDPTTGSPYTMTYGTANPTAVGNMEYSLGETCNSSGSGMTAGSANQYALLVYLEVGAVACYHN